MVEKMIKVYFCPKCQSKDVGYVFGFKNVFGISPYQYQIRRRLENAKLEILKGVSILDTAFAYGYADLASFSKAFKQAFGQSPSQFIK